MAGSQFTEEQIRRSLFELAKHAGNSVKAQAALATQGIELTDACLRDWRNGKYRDLYREIHETHAKEIEGQLVTEFRDLARASAAAALIAVDKTATALENGTIKDPAGASRNLATTAAISMDKLYLATDRPSVITERRDASEILNNLESRYGQNTVNGSAIEEKDAAPLSSESYGSNARELPVTTG